METLLSARHRKKKELNQHPSTSESSSSLSQTQPLFELTHGDLYSVPQALQSTILRDRFWKVYRQHYHSNNPNAATTALRRALWILAAPNMIPAGFWQFLAIISQVGVPLLVRQLLLQVEQHPNQRVPLGPAFAILALLVVYGLAHHRQRHLSMKAGATLRAALLAVLYQQVLQTSANSSLQNGGPWTAGQLTNLVAVDTHKIYEVVQEAHLLWALPLAMALVALCLLHIMGPVTLVGMTVLVALVPLVQRITTTLQRLRTRRVACVDQRVALTHALLQGMRVAKLHHDVPRYQSKLMNIRHSELHWLQKETAVWATTLSVSKLSAALAAAATFAVYVLVDEANILTAAESFSVFLLMAALRFPINYAGRLMGRLAQAQSSLTRIASCLDVPTMKRDYRYKELQHSDTPVSTDDPPSLTIRQGSFVLPGRPLNQSSKHDSIDDSTNDEDDRVVRSFSTFSAPFIVRRFDVTVHRGQVLACCGPVGGGKSTFLRGILGEAPPVDTDTQIQVRGELSFVPQTPFILNDTLRENILFGRPYDEYRFNRVVRACCLGPDIENLGPGRDLTEIGERGLTVSG